MDTTLETLPGEGETKLVIKTRIRCGCETCGEPAHFKHTFLLEGTRSNPASTAYRKDDCSWCEDECRYVCKKHERDRTPPDGYVWCGTFTASERFAHMFLKWHEREDPNTRRPPSALSALEMIYEYAGWHADDEADENNASPDDMVSHINGLIRQTCRKVLDHNETTTKTDRNKNAE